MRYLLGLLLSACWLLSSCTGISKQTIPVYVYHQFPPFIMGHRDDLSALLIKHLNEDTNFYWQLKSLSRSDLNQLRQEGERGVILWANPKWFGNSPDLVVSAPILWDADVFVFSQQNPLLGHFPEAIQHKTFCALTGHRYLSLEEYFAKGVVRVVERETIEECVALLQGGAVDFVQLEKSTLFSVYTSLLKTEIDFLEPAIDNFQRFALVDKSYSAVLPQLNQVITQLRKNPTWQKELENFGESRFIDLFDLTIEDLMRYEIN